MFQGELEMIKILELIHLHISNWNGIDLEFRQQFQQLYHFTCIFFKGALDNALLKGHKQMCIFYHEN